jgi:hypothetical protein
MKPLFNSIKLNKPRSNSFDLSHEKKLSLNMGELIPILVQEVIPGDRFRVNTEMLMRLAPMLAPMMHRVNVFTHFFFVPNRLVYSNWESFITGGHDGLEAPGFPTLNYNNTIKSYFEEGNLADYMGIVTSGAAAITHPVTINALPFRAYHLIYNEYYRDQTIQSPVGVTKLDSVDAAEEAVLHSMRKRCWEKDYFTSALNQTQRGAQVNIPGTPTYEATSKVYTSGGSAPTAGAVSAAGDSDLQTVGGVDSRIENIDEINISIQNLRRATRLQEWLERNNLAGGRYIEQILAHFGVMSSDSRLQRPEYLGGGKSPIVVSEVVSTVKEATNPQGNMSGHGLAVGNHHGFNKSFEEHGFIIGICSVLPRTSYCQGIPRMYSKVDKYDYFWPEFANIGEQIIYGKEIYYDGTDGNHDAIFGYTPRYAEYKQNQDSVHGAFRSSLDFYHMGRLFASFPTLSTAFVEANPTDRVFAVEDENETDKLWLQLYHDIKAIRPMPVYGTPTL